jgi:hypothetical protein
MGASRQQAIHAVQGASTVNWKASCSSGTAVTYRSRARVVLGGLPYSQPWGSSSEVDRRCCVDGRPRNSQLGCNRLSI